MADFVSNEGNREYLLSVKKYLTSLGELIIFKPW